MNAQIKIAVALALVAGGAAFFWLQSDQRPTRALRSLTPPASAASSPRTVAKLELERPASVAELDAAARAAGPREPAARPRAKPEPRPEPSLALLENVAPPPPRLAEPGHIAGTVVDELGRPIKARTMLVGPEGGSFGGGNSGADGAFDLERQGYESFQMKAWTRDGRVGVYSENGFDATLGVSDVVIRLEQGATVKLTLDGERATCRVGLSTNGILHSDFTLRRGETATEVVPVGTLDIELYTSTGANRIVHDSRRIGLSEGQAETLTFTVLE